LLNLFRDSPRLNKSTAQLRTVGQVDCVRIGELDWAYWYLPGGPQTILFIHGNSAGKEVFYKQFEGLAQSGYSLLAVDLPGHGATPNSNEPERDYNNPAIALCLKRLLAALDIRRPLIVGWSLGGHIAIEMAGRGFDLAGMMIFGTPPFGPTIVDFERAFAKSPAMEVTLKAERTEEDLEVYKAGLYGTFSPLPQAFHDLAERADGTCPEQSFAHWSTGDYGCHQRTVVRGWERPVCVLHGTSDAFVSADYLAEFPEDRFWKAEIIRMSRIGHAPFIEAPDVFNKLLREFCKDCF